MQLHAGPEPACTQKLKITALRERHLNLFYLGNIQILQLDSSKIFSIQ